MKKISVLLLAVCAAVFAQAASIDWSVSASKSNKIYGADGTTVFGKTSGDVAYLILADSADSIKDALAAGTFSASTEGVVGTASGYSTNGGINSSTATSSSLQENKAYDFAILMVNGDQSQYVMTAPISATTSDPDTVRDVQFTYAAVKAAGWQTAGGGDVPEPTSGLLLLVGGAMLALRRKQK